MCRSGQLSVDAFGYGQKMFITIECPITGKRVHVEIASTGVVAGSPSYAATIECPSCRKRHAWRELQTLGIVPPVAA
jgi:endogenous inhibitor of DNA gyrase (YacG/DUF329 family)